MGIAYNPAVVSNGLVLALDAGNVKSYNARENLVSYSTYNGLTWTSFFPAGASITSGIDAPDGTNTALRFSCNNTTNALLRVAFPSFTPNGTDTYTTSFYVRKISGTGDASTDLADGNPSVNYSGQLVTNQWVRVVTSAVPTATAKSFIDLFSDSNTSLVLDFWGVQVEKNPTVTNYTATSGSTITRSTTWTDLSGNSNTGTLVNSPTYNSSGYLNFSYTSSQSVSFASSSSLQFLNRLPYTLEAWVYPTRNPGANNWTGIFDREDSSIGSRDGYNIYFLGSATTTTTFTTERFVAGTATEVGYNIDSSLSVNAWQHIVATYDGTTLSLYRNGSSVGTPATSTGNISNTSKTLTIGVRGGQYFDGRISNTKIYNRALTPSEISQNFNATRGRYGV